MDTRSGEIVRLDEAEAQQAEMAWQMFEAGLTTKMPRYAPIKGDKIPVRPRRRRRRSYKDWCR